MTDHTGTFAEHRRELADPAPAYAKPVIRRAPHVGDREAFARLYLDAFVERFRHAQEEYRKRRRAFDTLYEHLPWDEAGSLAFRWRQVLQRLDRSDAAALAEIIRRCIEAETRPKPAASAAP